MRIVTLIENLVYKQGLIAEHGLSFYIETENKKILFDTGYSDAFIHNAVKLGVSIPDIDVVVISHGHSDHIGGLYPFLKANSKAKVFIKAEAFNPKHNTNGTFIGVEFDAALLNGRVEYVTDIVELDKDIYIMPNIPIVDEIDTHFEHFKVRIDNRFADDEFTDELYLAITANGNLSVISSCSHRGITNILNAAISHFKLPVHLILGGFHIKDCTTYQYVTITNFLSKISPKLLGVCHCTGVDKFAELQSQCDSKVFYNHTANEILIR